MKKIVIGVVVLALGIGAYFLFFRSGPAAKGPSYRTATVVRADIVSSVSATGKVTPRNTASGIPVGAQVNGKLIKLYVDYNSVVTNGQRVAQIDPLVYQATLDSAEAQLKVNEANVEVRAAALRASEAELALAQKTYDRKKALSEKKMAPVADLDSAEEALARAKSSVDQAKANLRSAEASVAQSKASVDKARADRKYCDIVSPVDGIVIDRKVEEGETVVSSMNAVPVLSIAEDLDVIWITADIPEADVGSVRVGQAVTFTVDAYKENGSLRTFTGKVRQVRKASSVTNNVVTFPVIIEAENPDQLLFPGMTATLSIETARATNVVTVPASALRFVPQCEVPAGGSAIWLVTEDGGLESVAVIPGTTDDALLEVCGPEAAALEGREVVLGYAVAQAGPDGKPNNPFMPKFPKKNKGKAPAEKK